MTRIRLLDRHDTDALGNVTPGLFDHPIRPDQARAFLESPLHAMVVAEREGEWLAFASGTVLLHPDKAPAFFINEVGTREGYRRQGLGRRVTQALMDHARDLGCDEGIWLGTETDNDAALALYRGLAGDEEVFVGFAWDGAFD